VLFPAVIFRPFVGQLQDCPRLHDCVQGVQRVPEDALLELRLELLARLMPEWEVHKYGTGRLHQPGDVQRRRDRRRRNAGLLYGPRKQSYGLMA